MGLQLAARQSSSQQREGRGVIYTASYFYPEHHHGLLVPLTRRYPIRVRSRPPIDEAKRVKVYSFDEGDEGIKLDPADAHAVSFLAPEPELAAMYKALGQEAFIQGYRVQLKRNLEAILEYLTDCDPGYDETWLTNAPPGAFSHRTLALKLVAKYRPDCLGGNDVPVVVYQPSLLETP